MIEHLTPFSHFLDKMTDEELQEEYKAKSNKVSPIPFFSVFAKRISSFKKLIFDDVIAKKNTTIKFRSIKPSWMIMLSVLDYCDDEGVKKELVRHIKKHWEKEDFESFSNYVRSEKRIGKYFDQKNVIQIQLKPMKIKLQGTQLPWF